MEQRGRRLGIHLANMMLTRVGREASSKLGTFAKRLSKMVYEQTNISLDPSIMGKIGSIVGKYTAGLDKYRADLADRFDWRQYDFGQVTGSCYWGSDRSHVRGLMQEYGFYAVRLFDDEDNGYSRVWVWPEKHRLTIFNAYSSGKETLITYGHLLSGLLGCSYRQVPALRNCDDDDGDLYINGGKGIMLFRDHSQFKECYDFQLDFANPDDDRMTCYNCDDPIDEGQEFHHAGNTYCEHCYDDHFRCCDRCGYSFDRDVLRETTDNGFYCNSCYDRIGCAQCYNCDLHVHPDQQITVEVEDEGTRIACSRHCEIRIERSLEITGRECGDDGVWRIPQPESAEEVSI